MTAKAKQTDDLKKLKKFKNLQLPSESGWFGHFPVPERRSLNSFPS